MTVYRHKRVVFGLTCSPFLLGATIDLHLKKILNGDIKSSASKEIIKKMCECFYSDNCVTSVDSVEELQLFKKEATSVLKSANFDLRGWEFTGDINKSVTSVLGLLWDKVTDQLSVNLSWLPDVQISGLTKRVILSVAQRVFDPIGFTCPVMLHPKLMLQNLWKENIRWDEELTGEVKSDFLKWLKNLSDLNSVKIPRRFGNVIEKSAISFHSFSDASVLAYAAALFIRVEVGDNVEVQLIGAKSRIAPTKDTTIPRLELLAATISARLTNSLIKEFNLENPEIIYWSDSTTVLTWINREAQWSTFVWNRVQEIRKLTEGSEWKHVPGTENPADLPSRGCSVSQLLASRWWEGPSWLKLSRSNWPNVEHQVDENEINGEKKKSAVSLTTIVNEKSVNKSVNNFVLFNRYSEYSKIVRIVAWCRRFILNVKIKKLEKEKRKLTNFITYDEILNSEKLLLKLAQKEMFLNEKDDKLKYLDVFKDESGLLRVKTKIFNREDDRNFRCPVVLDSSHCFVLRLIEETHRNLKHAHIQILINSLRENYWILSVRRKVRSVVSKCVICKRYNVKRMESEKSPLPIERVRDAAVFEVVGIDLAGPLYLKGNKKAYVCLFTCAVYRAIHLELLSSLSTPTFIKGFCRFIARRGRPSDVFTDNGTNFVGTENNLEKLNWDNIVNNSSVQRIKWHFNPPSAPWWGGWWERLIRIVKQLLRKVLSRASLDYEDMLTILCDCETIVNSRPLTYMTNDVSDLAPLTPNMFLKELPEIGVPDFDILQVTDIRERSRYLQTLQSNLRQRFRVEYLGQLRENLKFKESRELKLGDLVLIGSDDQKRLEWPLGRIISMSKGKDGHVRVYKIKTANGELTRPIQRLYPLEIDHPIVNDEKNVREIISGKINKARSRNENFKIDDLRKNECMTGTAEIAKPYVTRSGRTVKARVL